MPPTPPPPGPTTTVRVAFTVAEQPVQVALPVPRAAVPLGQVLPAVQALTDTMVSAAVTQGAQQGQRVTCRAGCGACCRQLVPITEVEARHLLTLVEHLPEPRRAAIRARFTAALSRLQDAGLLPDLEARATLTRAARRALGLRYFALGIPCPFLEAESCSIYADRPLVCREFLVSSPPENCAAPTAETVQVIPVEPKVSNALAAMDAASIRPTAAAPAPTSPPAAAPWVPLTLALDWAAAHPADGPRRSGPEWLQALFGRLAGKAEAQEPT